MMLKKLLLLSVLFSMPYALAMESYSKKLAVQDIDFLEDSIEILESWQVDLNIEEPLPFAHQAEQEECATITTQDDVDFKMPIHLAKCSRTLEYLIEDVGIEHALPLPTVHSNTWRLIDAFLTNVFIISSQAQGAEQAKNDTIKILQELKGDDLFNFIGAVNYLDIPVLLNIIIDIVKQADLQVLSKEQIARLPREIRNPIIVAQVVKLLPSLQGQQLNLIKGFKKAIHKICLSPDDSKVFTVHLNGMIRSWDINTAQQLYQFGQVTWGHITMCITPDGSKAILGFYGKPMRMWDLATNQEIPNALTLELPNQGNLYIGSMHITQDGTKIVCVNYNRPAIIWDIETGKILKEYQDNEAVYNTCTTPDSSKIVSCSLKGAIIVRDINTGKISRTKENNIGVHSMMVSPNGRLIVLNCKDNVLRIRDLTTGKVIQKIEIQDDIPCSMCISPDSTRIFVGLQSGAIRVIDIITGKQIAQFIGHKKPVNLLSVTSNGTHLISVSQDNTLRIWGCDVFKPLLAISAEQAMHIWHCLQQNNLAECSEYVQAIIAKEQQIPRG